MRIFWVWEVFSGQAALAANYLVLGCTEYLSQRERSRKYDQWGRPVFLSLCFWFDDGWVLSVRYLAIMSRKKGVQNAGDFRGDGTGSVGMPTWVNVDLGDEDVERCSELAGDVAGLSHGFVGLVSDGLDISLKRTGNGQFMACAYGIGDGGRRYGLSAWSDAPADAIAALLVKWHDRLGRTFSGVDAKAARPRFR